MQKGAIFDMDGTLVDTEKFFRDAWLETADKFGVERKLELAAAMSGSQRAEMPDILHKFYPKIDAEKYISRVYAQAEAQREKNIDLKSGVVEILEYFAEKKIPMAVASSSTAAMVEKNLTRTNIKKFFDVIVSGDDVEHGKPAPDIFLRAAEKIGVEPKNCYIFEDSFNGIRAAVAAKSLAIMVVDCVQPTDEIKKISAGIYNDFHEVLAAIKRGKI